MYGDLGLRSGAVRTGETRATSRRSVSELEGSRVDQPSFEDFVAARSPALLRTAYLLTRDRALTDDLVQTALAKVWPRWSRITADPEPYVRKVMVNTFTSWRRRRWRGEIPAEELPETGVAADYAMVEDREAIRDAMRRLPPKQRAVVVLRYFEDLSEAETAATLGCSPGNVKSQLSRALAKLRVDPALVDSSSIGKEETS